MLSSVEALGMEYSESGQEDFASRVVYLTKTAFRSLVNLVALPEVTVGQNQSLGEWVANKRNDLTPNLDPRG